ncbi:MAG: HNH endonuclease [Chloroflexi bacterium]|nr:HNH endonuclease [Chloroflexota bacterium]
MITLCAEHHAKADAGAFTIKQLRTFKEQALGRAADVRGRFDWMRRELLGVVGGNFYIETPVIFKFRGQPVIWFERDRDGHLLLNVRMLTTSSESRTEIENNFWLSQGDVCDFECPPSGRLLRVAYPNGDSLRVEFFELESAVKAQGRYPDAMPDRWGISFPVTAVEINENVAGTSIQFGPRETTIGGAKLINNVFRNCGAAINLN